MAHANNATNPRANDDAEYCILGDGAARDVHLSDAQEGALVHADELLEGPLVAGAERLHELHLLELRGGLHAPDCNASFLPRD